MIIRYRHYAALLRRGYNAVAFGKLSEEELLARQSQVFDVIAKELLASPVQWARSIVRNIVASALPWEILPFNPNLPLGKNGQREYANFRRWLKMKLE